jgi:hypothetical protein
MKRFVLVLAAAASLALGVATVTASGHDRNFTAHLTGEAEVGAVDTRATGQAVFQLSADGTELHYRLIVANIQDVLQAHIHLAPAGENGAVVAFLYPSAPPAELIPGRSAGVLQTGTITSADLIGPLAGMTLEDLLAAMRAGDTYVNVHTTADPGGHIRGQIG